jgi:two-component system chemotaxis sensor kinase CheA
MVHVIRNAVDHGIETAERRVQAQKSEKAKLMLRSRVERDHLILEVGDDGKGVDWDRVRKKAEERGLPHDTQKDLVSALFSDGLSTREQVDTTSGRGVGMSAVREAAQDLGGDVDVWSEPGQGTIIRIDLPMPKPPRESLRAAAS